LYFDLQGVGRPLARHWREEEIMARRRIYWAAAFLGGAVGSALAVLAVHEDSQNVNPMLVESLYMRTISFWSLIGAGIGFGTTRVVFHIMDTSDHFEKKEENATDEGNDNV
jgi:hypothetical protein